MGPLARTALAAAACLALAGCNTANTLPTDDETATLGPARCPSGMIVGAGSALHQTAFEEALAAYGERCDHRSSVQFNAVTSEEALRSFRQAEIDWIAADAPLADNARATAVARCGTHPLLTLPVVANPIVLTYHLPEVDRLVLTGPVAGRILDGTITTWNHPDITALNPGVRLPVAPIAVVGRADASGATELVSRYLVATGAWPAEQAGRNWTGAGEKKEQTAGVIQAVRATPNSIGYAEYSAAQNNGLPMVWLDNGAGPVEPSVESAGRALTEATMAGAGGDLTVTPEFTQTAAGSYPLVSVGYQITCSSGFARGKAPVLRDFFSFFVSEPQQQSLAELGLVPLPAAVTDRVTESIAGIR
jgi:phosphate transport system substrate-binding protein